VYQSQLSLAGIITVYAV